MMFMYSEAPFLDIRYRTQIHHGAEINTPENIGRLAQQAAGGRSYHLEPYGSDGDVIFQLERKEGTPEKCKVLFTGTGRCGTQYISNLFTANGIDVGHELVEPYLPGFVGQSQVGYYRVDYAEVDSRIAVEVQGCWYHNCQQCFPGSPNSETQKLNTANDVRKHSYLINHGWTVVYLWEHDIRQDAEETVMKNVYNQ
jgi:Uncharacterized protein conserved in bacteria